MTSPSPSPRRVLVRPRTREVQARTDTFDGQRLLRAGDVVTVLGDKELPAAVFMILSDEPAVYAEVAQ